MSHFEAAIARIQDIESRLGITKEPPASPLPPKVAGTQTGAISPASLPNLSGMKGTPQPFNLALAQASGNVQLQPTGKGGPPFAPYVEGLIAKYAAQNGVQPELVRAVIRQESDGNPRDVSHAGARGLMQLMPEEIQELGVTDPFDPEQNIAAGTRLLGGLLKQHNGDVPLALAAYNAGSGAVKKYNGIPPYAETRHYVKKIMGMLGSNE
jgi:soluble lytic murein transglycosylase-like protein